MDRKFYTGEKGLDRLDLDAYMALFEEQAGRSTRGLDEEEAERVAYTKLNLHRSRRIARTYVIDEELGRLIDAVEAPQLWMVLTEPWCGDSAQCLPHIAVMAERNPAIELRMLLRDENLDVMDLYLTGASRSIPRLVAFGDDDREIFRWGPRPAAAQTVVDEAKAAGLAKPDLLEKLHLWYGRDRGASLAAEFRDLLARQIK